MLEQLNDWMNVLLAGLLEVSWINEVNDALLAHSTETALVGVLVGVGFVFVDDMAYGPRTF